MSETGKIIRGAGGYLKRNTDLGVGIGHPHGGEEGDIRVQMVDGSPKLFAKAGGVWYGVSLKDETVAELKIGTSTNYIELDPNVGINVVNNSTDVASLGQTLRIGRDSTGASALRVESDGSMSIGIKDATPQFAVSATGDITFGGELSTAVDLSGLTEAAVAAGDYFVFFDGGITGVTRKDNINDLATLFAGAGLTASSGVIALTNNAVSFGGISVALGASDATPAFDLSDATAYTGDSSLVTTGTIASGTWEATTIAVDQGGTGATSLNNLITLGDHTTGNYVATLTAGTLIDLQNNSGETASPTVDVDLTEAVEAAIANGDYILFLDGGATGTHAKEAVADLATLFAGTNLTASSSVIGVDDSFIVNDAADIMVVSDFGANAALKIDADQPATAGAENSKGLWIDYDRIVAGSGTAAHNDIGIDLDVNSASLGTSSVIGMDIDVVGATTGTHTATGLTVTVGSSDTNYAALFNGGNVGIGIVAPGSLLHISKTGGADFKLSDSNNTAIIKTVESASNSNLAFYTHSTHAMTILGSNQNVGIGTVTPEALLHTHGTSAIEHVISVYSNTEANSGSLLFRKADASKALVDDDAILGTIAFQGWDGDDAYRNGAQIVARINGTPADGVMPCDLEFWTNTGGTGTTQRMTILESGNVGIGVIDPDVTLEVLAGTTNQLKLSFDGTDNCTFGVDTSGHLTITPSGNKVLIADDDILSSASFTSGFAGNGWIIDDNTGSTADATFDNLAIRGTMSVYELLIQQIRATNGNVMITSSAKVESVSGLATDDDAGTITFEPAIANTCPFVAGDIILCQQVNPGALVAIGAASSGVTGLIKKMVYRVASVSNNIATVSNISGGSETAFDNTAIPVAGDEFVRIGNYDDSSYASRQSVMYLTSDDTNAPYIDMKGDLNSYADWTSEASTKLRLGRLDGLTAGGTNEYGLWAGPSTTNYIKAGSAGVFIKGSEATYLKATANTIEFFDTNKKMEITGSSIKMYADNGSTVMTEWDNTTLTLGGATGDDSFTTVMTASDISIFGNDASTKVAIGSNSIEIQSNADVDKVVIDNTGMTVTSNSVTRATFLDAGVTIYGDNATTYASVTEGGLTVVDDNVQRAYFAGNSVITGGTITLQSDAAGGGNDDRIVIGSASIAAYTNDVKVLDIVDGEINIGPAAVAGTAVIHNVRVSDSSVFAYGDHVNTYAKVSSAGLQVYKDSAGDSGLVATYGADTLITGGSITLQGTTGTIGDEKVVIENNSISMYSAGAEVFDVTGDVVTIGNNANTKIVLNGASGDLTVGKITLAGGTGVATITEINLAGRIKTSGIGTSVVIGDYNMTAVSASDLTSYYAIQNVVIGEAASQDVTVATSRRYQNNVAIGTGATKNINPAGTAFTSAQTEDNVHIGHEAGGFIWGGDGNIGIGKLALSGTTDGGNSSGEIQNYNIGIGWSAGADINAGSYNICIGYQAGNTGDGIEDGNGNVVIGYGEPAADADRTLNIGTRNASNLTTWITGTSPAGASGWGNIGMGVAPGDSRLALKGSATGTGTYGITVENSAGANGFYVTDAGTSYFPGVYDDDIGTERDLLIQSDGQIGYDASSKAFKTNIQSLVDVSWLNQLNPVTFSYREKDDEGNVLDSANTEKGTQHGLIAEEVWAIQPDLCHKATAEEKERLNLETDAIGVKYKNIVPALIKAIQELSAKVTALEAQI